MDSIFIKHEACPRCRRRNEDRSGNNLAVYTDHVYCFKCGYRAKTGNNGKSFSKDQNDSGSESSSKLRGNSSNNKEQGVLLPHDFVFSMPDGGYQWLKKYELTDREIARNRIGWSESGLLPATRSGKANQYGPCMIFPIYDIYGNLLMYQARYFGKDTNLPKYLTKGKPAEILHVLGTNDEQPIVIVEDLISAIKVSRVCRSVPIFGSSPSLAWFSRLHKITDSIILWLDMNKRKDSEKLKHRLSVIFKEVESISTELDPKSNTESEIESKISGR